MNPEMNDAYLKMVFYWIRHNLTYIGNRRNYSDYAGIMPESSLAALLSSNESASTIKCITKQTWTVTNYRKESEGVERPFCHCVVSVQASLIHLAQDSPGRWGNTCNSQETTSSLGTRPPWKDHIWSDRNPGSSSQINTFNRILEPNGGPSGRDRSFSPAGMDSCCVRLPSCCFWQGKQLNAGIVC